MSNYDLTLLEIYRQDMNHWRSMYAYWRMKLGEANRGLTFLSIGEIFKSMNQARCALKDSMKDVEGILYAPRNV